MLRENVCLSQSTGVRAGVSAGTGVVRGFSGRSVAAADMSTVICMFTNANIFKNMAKSVRDGMSVSMNMAVSTVVNAEAGLVAELHASAGAGSATCRSKKMDTSPNTNADVWKRLSAIVVVG